MRPFAGASLRPPLAFNPRPRCLTTPTDAFELHPDVASYGLALNVEALAAAVSSHVHTSTVPGAMRSDAIDALKATDRSETNADGRGRVATLIVPHDRTWERTGSLLASIMDSDDEDDVDDAKRAAPASYVPPTPAPHPAPSSVINAGDDATAFVTAAVHDAVRGALALRCVLYTGPHTTPSAW